VVSTQVPILKLSARLSIGMLAVGETIVWSCLYYIFPALLLRWEWALEWSKLELTGAITLALFVSAVFSPLFGKFIDRGFGPVLMAGGALVGGLVILLLTVATKLWQFYTVWIVIGACFSACLYEPCFALLTRAYGKDAKRRIIIVTLVAGFASSISFPVAHYIANFSSWETVVRVFSLLVIFVGVPLLYFGAGSIECDARANKTETNRSDDVVKTVYLRDPLFLNLGISFALLALVHGATLHHLLHILGDRGLTLGASVLVASLIGPMQVFGRLVITAFQNQFHHHWIAFSCFVLMGLALVLLYLSSLGLMVAICFAVIFGSGYGIVSIIRPVIARDLLGEEHFGAKSGLLAFFYLLGSAAAPYVGSLVWSAGGYNLLIGVLLVLALSGMVLIFQAIARVGKTPI